MAAVGAVKVGAILWETTFTAWSLLHVLILPLIGGGLLLGIGAGHDGLVSRTGAQRLAVAGLLILSVTAGWASFGPPPPPTAWVVALPLGAALIGVFVGGIPVVIQFLSGREPPPERVRSG